MFKLTFFRFFLSVGALSIIVGCASFGERTLKVRRDFESGNIQSAKAEVDKGLKKNRKKEADLLKLNQAVLELSSGNAKQAEQLLREVRDNFDKNENEQLRRSSEKVTSMLLDDNAVSYNGEDYEKVLIRVFLALSNLMHDGGDATAYALQIAKKQNEIIQKGGLDTKDNNGKPINLKAESYRQVAIGEYLVGTLAEETYRNPDDVRKAYQLVCAWEPNFKQGMRDWDRSMRSVPCQAGNGVVYVIGLVGAGPLKVQQNCEVLQASQFITTAMLSMMSNRPMIPDFAPVMIPCVVRPMQTVSPLNISVDGKWNGQTETITDICGMAEEQFEAVKPQIIARAVIRRMLKKSVVYGTKEATDSNPWVSLALELGGILWESFETADTRCWNLLPAEIQIARLEVPAGEHQITLKSRAGFSGNDYRKTIRVDAGRNTYVLANFPNGELVGEISVNRR